MEPILITVLEDFSAVHVEQGTYRIYRTEYVMGGMAIFGTDENDEPWFTLSVRMEESPNPPGEFWVKDWSENEGIGDALAAKGVIEFTGEIAENGFVTEKAARLTEEYR